MAPEVPIPTASVRPDLPRTCIIGAGASGIAVAKSFHDRGLPFVCFEASDRAGGNWVFKNPNGMSSAYRSLHINTSREKMGYSDFPLPREYPDYPHHSEVARYLDSYIDHFGFRSSIRFGSRVRRAEPDDNNLWRVILETGETHTFDALVVANGHHWDPRLPTPAYPGSFDGPQIHSHSYSDPEDPIDCRDKNVLVVGFGNSALDIACELGRKGVARHVFLSQRRGYWVVPKYLNGKASDSQSPHPSEEPPWWLDLLPKSWIVKAAERRLTDAVGRPEDFGLLPPDHKFLATHPAISQEIHLRLGSGDITSKPNVRMLQGNRVAFTDDTVERIDVIIWCTGYKISFPFFDESIVSAPNNDIALWQRIVDPRYLNLFFVGLVQPLCAMMPIAEQQAKLISAYLAGDYALPPVEYMDAERIEMHLRTKRNYVASARHTIQIDCSEYARELRRELRRGALRANADGNPLPVPARAAALPQLVRAAQ